MRLRDILAVIALVIVAVGGEILRSGDTPPPPTSPPGAENPRRPAPRTDTGDLWDAQTRAWLESGPTASPRQNPFRAIPQQAIIDVPKDRGSGTGTAFAIGPNAWLTARHVVDGCDQIGLQIGPRKGIRVTDVRHHPNADVSLLRTRSGQKPFPMGYGASNGVVGYMVGFPQGKPGAVYGQKIGTTTLRERGRFQTRETADVWSERSRVPNRFGSLGGLSGGPVFTSDGRITGVVLAEERRRGRIMTAQPATLRTVLDRASLPVPDGTPATQLTAADYPHVARDLLLSLRVSKVLCRVR